MGAIIWKFEGMDLVVPREVLAGLGLRPGDPVAIQPVRSPRDARPRVAHVAVQGIGMCELWAQASLEEVIDAECRHEIAWESWSRGRG